MNWEELSSDDFTKAVRKAQGVCLVPIGCMERHGHHLPLGTDMFIAREMCRRIAAVEPAVIFPDVFLTQILEARHCAGTVAADPDLIVKLLDNVCREISRNGLKKIIFVNAHGGNMNFLQFFIQCQLASRHDYVVYLAKPQLSKKDKSALEALWQAKCDGHAGESETSQILAIRPDLVNLKAIPKTGEGLPRKWSKKIQDCGAYTASWWYSDHPTHYRGDNAPASKKKGELELNAYVRSLVTMVRAVKKDTISKRLQEKFYSAAENL